MEKETTNRVFQFLVVNLETHKSSRNTTATLETLVDHPYHPNNQQSWLSYGNARASNVALYRAWLSLTASGGAPNACACKVFARFCLLAENPPQCAFDFL